MAEENAPEITADGGSASDKTKRAYKKSSKKISRKAPAGKTAKKAAKGKGATGTRYSQETKDEAVAYIHDNPGRGIIGKALKKYGVSYISLRNWLKNAGKGRKAAKVPGTGKRGRPAGKPAAPGKVSGSKVTGDGFDSIIAQIQQKRFEIKGLLAKLTASEP